MTYIWVYMWREQPVPTIRRPPLRLTFTTDYNYLISLLIKIHWRLNFLTLWQFLDLDFTSIDRVHSEWTIWHWFIGETDVDSVRTGLGRSELARKALRRRFNWALIGLTLRTSDTDLGLSWGLSTGNYFEWNLFANWCTCSESTNTIAYKPISNTPGTVIIYSTKTKAETKIINSYCTIFAVVARTDYS